MTDVVVTMDRSKYHSSVHGERTPGDPHHGVCFFQDGLPFDAAGRLLLDKVDQRNPELVALAQRKVKQAEAARAARAKGADGAGKADGPPAQGDPNDVNLEAWLRGELQYHWSTITQTVKARYGRVVADKKQAVNFLVADERLLTPEQIAPENRALLPVIE